MHAPGQANLRQRQTLTPPSPLVTGHLRGETWASECNNWTPEYVVQDVFTNGDVQRVPFPDSVELHCLATSKIKSALESMTTRKTKLSLTVSADLLELVDRDVRKLKGTRSSVVELWLRRAATLATERSIESATAAYYLSLQAAEAEEPLSRALSKAAKRVSYDPPVQLRRAAS
jgi:hypothetical protein